MLLWKVLARVGVFAHAEEVQRSQLPVWQGLIDAYVALSFELEPETRAKRKFHLLQHLSDAVDALGPAPGFNTSHNESMHSESQCSSFLLPAVSLLE